eukprot:TRINITY_DN9376_c0_g1_i2.p1 TRINITY_DN9376_c0_g1~~TRINITY_DN9376_c0_g1_i2.p1  ORF type:complete len:202 (+),score=40.97 TRINITY_DN9376_c0_g1_i2:60-608(+)
MCIRDRYQRRVHGLRENLDPKNELSDETINEVFRLTQLQIRGISNETSDSNLSSSSPTKPPRVSIKDGDYANLGFEVANSGSNLSNGERQIINFLRVFLHQKDIVCLDEANSNLDPHTDDKLMQSLFELCKTKTLLMISHRLENLTYFDRIFVLENGEIVEEGDFSTLSGNPSSLFNRLRSR